MQETAYSLEILLAIGAGLLLLGFIIGNLLGRRSSSAGKKYREVERKLDQVLQDKKLYEDEVVEHFTETAQLLNNLTDSYRRVHNHIASGASKLCEGQGPVSLEQMSGDREPAEIPDDLVQLKPPLDYAPKSSPDEKGMLSEAFGLERNAPQREQEQETGEETQKERRAGA